LKEFPQPRRTGSISGGGSLRALHVHHFREFQVFAPRVRTEMSRTGRAHRMTWHHHSMRADGSSSCCLPASVCCFPLRRVPVQANSMYSATVPEVENGPALVRDGDIQFRLRTCCVSATDLHRGDVTSGASSSTRDPRSRDPSLHSTSVLPSSFRKMERIRR
jgi:hypothetical protein